jgi:NADH dehydrogenase (ubiquinone) 1 alpha/beta subcomplex 1
MSVSNFSRSDVERTVLSVLKGYGKIDPGGLKLESHFHIDLGLDSVDVVEVMMAIEDQFAIEIPESDAWDLVRPKLIVDYLCKRFGTI